MDALWKDFRHSLRTLRKTPVVTVAAILSLALGIGANTTIFTLVNAILLNPVPVERPDRIVSIMAVDQRDGGAGSQLPMSWPNFEDYHRQSDQFSTLVAFLTVPTATIIGKDPERIFTQLVSQGYFSMLGVEPAHGRFFLPEENDTVGSSPVAVISHGLWKRQYAADPDVLGREVKLNGASFSIVGVAPAGFSGTSTLLTPGIWIPMTMRQQVLSGPFRAFFDLRRGKILDVIGRLHDDVDVAQVEASTRTIAERLAEEYPNDNRDMSLSVLPLTQANIPPSLRGVFLLAGTVMMAAVGLVLLIACVNVANLLLVRARARRTEISVRLALGAPRRRLVRQLLSEGLVLSLAGGAAGLLLAWWGRDLLWSLRPPLLSQTPSEIGFDGTVLLFTVLLSLGTGILFGLVPALRASRPDLISALRDRSETPGSQRLLTGRNLLVASQVALSLLGLVASGLFLTSLRQLESIDPGFDAQRLATAGFNLGTQGYEPARAMGFYRRVREVASADPAVDSVALAANLPLGVFPGVRRTVIPEGRDLTDPTQGSLVLVDTVDESYFDTLGIPLAEGRPFQPSDRQDSRPVVIVNEALATSLWPNDDALGKRIALIGETELREVVGVARNRKHGTLGETPIPYLHLPLEQNYTDAMRLFVRTDGDPAVVLARLRQQIQQLDPTLPLTEVETLGEVLGRSLWGPRLATLLLGVFGFLALVLAAVGIYGVMSYSISRRNRELGLRMALGAERPAVLRMVLLQGMKVVTLGLALGLLAAAVVTRPLAGQLPGVQAFDVPAFSGALIALAAVALIAILVPARRATTVDPLVVMRTD
ncbi:MAG: ABC transporter permease [Acidobacteriota bacterium]